MRPLLMRPCLVLPLICRFWPATVFFPIHCWIKVFKPSRRMKIFLWCLDIFCLLVTILAIAGSIQLIVDQASTFKPFSS